MLALFPTAPPSPPPPPTAKRSGVAAALPPRGVFAEERGMLPATLRATSVVDMSPAGAVPTLHVGHRCSIVSAAHLGQRRIWEGTTIGVADIVRFLCFVVVVVVVGFLAFVLVCCRYFSVRVCRAQRCLFSGLLLDCGDLFRRFFFVCQQWIDGSDWFARSLWNSWHHTLRDTSERR